MAKIYGTPIMAGGAGGANKDLPPLLDNFKAFKGGGTSENPHITIQADKMLESRANELAGAVWVYGDHEPESVNDGTKIQLSRDEVVEGAPLSSLLSGSKIKFGRYNGQPLTWELGRDVETNEMFLVMDGTSMAVLGKHRYNNSNETTNFGLTTLCHWLNFEDGDDFLSEFTSVELSVMNTEDWSYGEGTIHSPVVTVPVNMIDSNTLDIFTSEEDWVVEIPEEPSGTSYWISAIDPALMGGFANRFDNDSAQISTAQWNYEHYVRPICVPNPSTPISGPDDEGYYTIGGEATVQKTVQWNNESDFFARQFTYNSKKQYQTMLEGALASVIVEGAPAQVTDLVVSGSGGTATLTWVNPVDDPVYAETVVVWKVGSAPSDITDGTEIYRGTDQTCTATGLEQSTDYYFAVYTVSGLGVYGQPVISDVYRYDFPAEPTEYSEIEEITDSTTWKLPEDGYFLICALGKSGNGGRGLSIISAAGGGGTTICSLAAGGSGGTGSFAEKVVSGYKGDEYVFTITNSDTKVDYLGAAIINAKAGGNGTDGYRYGSGNSWVKNGSGGNGGTSSALEGSAIQNGKPGNNGAYWSYREQGSGSRDPGVVYGGAAVSSEYTSTIAPSETFITSSGAGGNGNANRSQEESYTNGGTGTSGKIIIYRGNTNQPSPSTVSALSLTPRNASIEASWTNSEDPESVGTLLVSNPTHEPQDITDGTSIDVAEATSYTLTDLPNDKPTYISLFSYNADKSKYSAAKSDVEIPREVTWADTQDALEQDEEEKTEQLTIVTQEYEAEVKTMASVGISQVKAYCEATSNPPMADVGVLASGVEEWKPDTEYKLNDLFTYQGNMGYVKQPTLTSLDVYPPFSVGTEALYGARPKPDADGIYPYVYNMGIYEGMLVRDDDGFVYRSITGTQERPTELLYHPKDVPALLVKVEEEAPEEPEYPNPDEPQPSEEYPEWVQPTGAHDAYAQGAKVSHNGKE